jgi:hypothetical protein
MTTEEQDDGEFIEVAQPDSAIIGEDEILIFDTAEFAAKYECVAAMLKGGQLWVLDDKTSTWRDVAKAKAAGMRSIK